MTIGERLLELAVEYVRSTDVRAEAEAYASFGGKPAGREPSEIAADFNAALSDATQTQTAS